MDLGCEDILKFSDKWIAGWSTEYDVSLQTPNKRFSLPRDVRIRRIVQLLKNIIRVGAYFFKFLGVDIQVVNMDQMPLHRNETARSKSLNIKNTVS